MWRRRRRSTAPPAVPFDAWLAGLQRSVGRLQLGLAERLARHAERRAEARPAVVVDVPAEGDAPAVTLDDTALRGARAGLVQSLELGFDAAVERDDAGRYSFVLDPAAAAPGARAVRLRVRLAGPQPGDAEVYVAGALFKRVRWAPAPEAGVGPGA